MTVKLITFADGSFGIKAAGRRLARQGISSGYFDGGCEVWNLARLESADQDFRQNHSAFLRAHPKGFGLWVWQPAFLLAAMNESIEGDVIVALDSGCQLISNQIASLQMEAYVSEVKRKGSLFVQIREGSFGLDDLREKAWTKRECVERLNVDAAHLESTQIQSGIIFVLNTVETRDFVSRWYRNCVEDRYALLLEPADSDEQVSEYVAHRYSQSILSLMVKQESLPKMLDDTYWYPAWSAGLHFPIWSMRNRSGGDAFRRSPIDLLSIGLAKIERKVREKLFQP